MKSFSAQGESRNIHNYDLGYRFKHEENTDLRGDGAKQRLLNV
jgi:hypothetical protein